ncbi:MAG: hypothetical protein IKP76_04650 [Bacilli bacterium]|nr:hypothetical protein [Bacilli bacterium]
MEVLANENVVIKANKYYDEIDDLVKYINSYIVPIFDYLSLSTNKMCNIRLLDSKEELDLLYKELMQSEGEKNSHKEVPSNIASFIYENDLFILNYESFIDVYQHNRTTQEEFFGEIVGNLVSIFQTWKYGKLTDNPIINKGLAVYLSGQDINSKILIDSYIDLKRSNSIKAYGNFYKYIDNTLDREGINKLLSNNIDEDRLRKIYDGYKHQFLSNRGK